MSLKMGSLISNDLRVLKFTGATSTTWFRGGLILAAANDPVNRYLGDFPVRDRIQSDQPVTFTGVLSHWSGRTSWPGWGETTMKPVRSRELPKSLEEVCPGSIPSAPRKPNLS